MSSNGSPQLNCCRVLHLSPIYVPHETTTRASISPHALASIPGLRPERPSPPPALPSSTLKRHAEARSLLPTPHFRPLCMPQPTILTPPEPAPPYSIPIDQRPRTERLPSSRCIRIARTQLRRCRQQSNPGDPDTALRLSVPYRCTELAASSPISLNHTCAHRSTRSALPSTCAGFERRRACRRLTIPVLLQPQNGRPSAFPSNAERCSHAQPTFEEGS